MTRSSYRLQSISLALTAAVLSTSATAPHAQAQAPVAMVDSVRAMTERASATTDDRPMELAEQFAARALLLYPNDARLLHYAGFASYRRAVAAFTAGNPQAAGPHLTSAAHRLSKSAETLNWAESPMLLASITGMFIALDESRGMELAQVIGEYSAQAMRSGADNPRVLLLQAYSAERTPPEYGGGIDRAKALLTRALAKFATDRPAPQAPAWGRQEAIAFAQRLGVPTPDAQR